MLISKQLKSFVHSKALQSVFRDSIFEVSHPKSTQISVSILEISSKNCAAHQKLNFNASKLLLVRNGLVTQFCEVWYYVARNKIFLARNAFH